MTYNINQKVGCYFSRRHIPFNFVFQIKPEVEQKHNMNVENVVYFFFENIM